MSLIAPSCEERMMIAGLEDVSRSILVCTVCEASSEAYDARKSPHAWDDWTISPKPKCPHCNGVAKAIQEKKHVS